MEEIGGIVEKRGSLSARTMSYLMNLFRMAFVMRNEIRQERDLLLFGRTAAVRTMVVHVIRPLVPLTDANKNIIFISVTDYSSI